VLSRDIIQELASLLPEIEARPPRALVVIFGEIERIHCWRRHQGFHGTQDTRRKPMGSYGPASRSSIASQPSPARLFAAIHGFCTRWWSRNRGSPAAIALPPMMAR